MKFEVQREVFLRALRVVSGGVDKKSTGNSEVLSGIFISIVGDELCLVTTDQDMEVSTKVPLEGPFVAGQFVISFRKLLDICRALPDGECLYFNQEAEKIFIKAGRSRYSLGILSVKNFPTFTQSLGLTSFSVPKKEFRGFIESTCFAIAEQDVRLYLNGMLLECKENKLYSVASDGHRLAMCSIPLVQSTDRKEASVWRVLVPKKTVFEWLKVVDGVDGEVLCEVGERQISVSTGATRVISRLLEAQFPEYQRLIPQTGILEVIANRQLLKEAFNRAAALFSDRFRAVRLRLSPSRLVLTAATTEHDKVEEDLDVVFDGEPFEIVFNIKYLLDCLQVIQGERVKFVFSGLNSSTKLQAEDKDDSTYIIMPMKF